MARKMKIRMKVNRAVIGANSVVTRDVPAGTIAAGAPAKVIREIEFKPGADG